MIAGAVGFGLSGSLAGVNVIQMSYISDVTTKDRRPFRIALVDMILLISLTVGNFAAGIFLQKYGFLFSFLVAFCLYVSSLFYIVFILKESHPKSQRCSPRRSCLTEPLLILEVIRRQRPERSKVLLLTMIAGACAMLGPSVIMDIRTLFLMNSPLCWTASQLGIYRSVYFATNALAAVVGVKLLPCSVLLGHY